MRSSINSVLISIGWKLKTSANKKCKCFLNILSEKDLSNWKPFAIQLQLAMDLEASVEIKIKGFTSPLNDTEYNMALAKEKNQ